MKVVTVRKVSEFHQSNRATAAVSGASRVNSLSDETFSFGPVICPRWDKSWVCYFRGRYRRGFAFRSTHAG